MIDRSKGDRWEPNLREQEHIDIHGHLNVPVKRSIDSDPRREGWEAFWVNVNLDADVQKVVKYKRIEVVAA